MASIDLTRSSISKIASSNDAPVYGESFQPLQSLEPFTSLEREEFLNPLDSFQAEMNHDKTSSCTEKLVQHLTLEPFTNFNINEIFEAVDSGHAQQGFLKNVETSEGQSLEQKHGSRRLGFCSLPPEIREIIYQLYFAGEANRVSITSTETERLDPSNPSAQNQIFQRSPPVQPSITRVSRLIRQESLPYWYAVSRVPLQFRVAGWYESAMGVLGTPNYEQVPRVPPSIYPMLRKLELSFELCGPTSNKLKSPLCFKLDLDKSTNSYTIKHA